MIVLFSLVLLLAVLALVASVILLLVRVVFKKGITVKQAGLAAGLSFALIVGSTIGAASTIDEVEAAENEQAEAQEQELAEEQRVAEEEAEKLAAEKEEARLAAEKLAEEQAAEEALAKEKEEQELLAKKKAEKEALAKEKEEQELLAKEKAAEDEKVIQLKNELFAGYELIEVEGGDLSGYRESNVVVDIGFGDREYWAFTNDYGQLVRVIAAEIILQDDENEPVLSSGRYYWDEAKVPGTESAFLDEGHVIADSLGGVANAYNITPQESTLNRHGDQAYMENVIRSAGGATNFEAIITYPDKETQIPSSYQFTYTVKGNEVVDNFDNVNPDEVNAELGLTESEPAETPSAESSGDISSVDTNGNGKVTIQEAKDAGFSMPIYSNHWLYPYMDDRDGDGMVGE